MYIKYIIIMSSCHAYFSQKQKASPSKIYNRKEKGMELQNHTNIYLTVDGKEVEVSEIRETKFDHKKYFTDSIYVGIVTKWIRIKYD